MTASIRTALCLAVLGVLLMIGGTAADLASGARGPASCQAQLPGSPASGGTDPCVRSAAGGAELGVALLPLGVLALIGAGVVGITAPR